LYHQYNVDLSLGEELQSHDGPRLILQALKLYNNIIRGEDETHLVDDLNDLLKGTFCK
jgi:hypothetical protein